MRIIFRKRLLVFAVIHPHALSSLEIFHTHIKAVRWELPSHIKKSFNNVDAVKSKRGKNLYVFNVGGNKYRVISAIHFADKGKGKYSRFYVLRVLTHDEYIKLDWISLF